MKPSIESNGKLNEFPRMNFQENDSFPMDISSNKFMSISLPPLIWLHQNDTPSEIKIRNSGYLLNVEPKYSGQVPTLSGSVLRCPYEFWCFHFHWGSDNEHGSEHRLDGRQLPMEIHLVFYNVKYLNTNEALKAKDGILTLVYMCKLTDRKNVILDKLTSKLERISGPNEVTHVDPFPMSSLFDGDLTDYMMYWRAYGDADNEKQTPWIISLKPVWINESQLHRMRSLRGSRSPNITSNVRCQVRYRRSENVFIVTTDDTRAVDEGTPVNAGDLFVAGTPGAPVSYDLEGGRAYETDCSNDREAPGLQSIVKMDAIRSMSILMLEHSENDVDESKTETDILLKTCREGVRMNKTTIRREKYIKDRLQKIAELRK